MIKKKIGEDNKEAINGINNIDISLDVVRQYQQSGYVLLIRYKKNDINALKRLIFKDSKNTT